MVWKSDAIITWYNNYEDINSFATVIPSNHAAIEKEKNCLVTFEDY